MAKLTKHSDYIQQTEQASLYTNKESSCLWYNQVMLEDGSETAHPIISLEYRNQQLKIPLARNIEEFKKLIQEEVLPAYKKVKKTLNSNAEIAVSEYVYLYDESASGQKGSTEQMLHGLGITEKTELEKYKEALIFRRGGLNPVLSDRLSWRKENPDEEVGDRYLPFANRTFIIGPMVVDESILKQARGPTLEEDTKASTLFVGNSIAVDGSTLLKLMGKKNADKVTNIELVGGIEKIINNGG